MKSSTLLNHQAAAPSVETNPEMQVEDDNGPGGGSENPGAPGKRGKAKVKTGCLTCRYEVPTGTTPSSSHD